MIRVAHRRRPVWRDRHPDFWLWALWSLAVVVFWTAVLLPLTERH